MKKNERMYFEGFKRTNISEEELKNAKEKASFLGEMTEKFLLLVRMVEAALRGEYEIDLGSLALLIAAVIYVVSPIDAAPDFLPFVGWLDDVSVVGIIFKILENMILKFEEYEKEKNKIQKVDYKNE